MRLLRQTFRLTFPAWCALVCGVAATILMFMSIQAHQRQLDDENFARRALVRTVVLDHGISHAVKALQVVNQFFVSSGNVSTVQFHSFTKMLLARHPYIDTFMLSRLVKGAERPAFEAQMRSRHPGFAITDMVHGERAVAALRERYRVVDYTEPLNQKNHGIDASTHGFALAAVQRAEDSGLPAATGLFRREQDNGVQRGLRIIMALYQAGGKTIAAPAEIEARRRTVAGYTVAVLDLAALFKKIFASVDATGNAGLDIRIYAPSAAGGRVQVYGPPDAAQEAPAGWLMQRLQPASTSFDRAGSTWQMVISAQPQPLLAMNDDALAVLLTGLLATLIASTYMQSNALRAHSVQQLVAHRTSELKQANARLVSDIDIRQQVEKALRESRSDLRKLANHQESVKEDERKRIARDIHDELGQNLMALRIDVSMLQQYPDASAATKRWAGVALQQIDTTIKSVRNIINDLRPPVLDLGLHAALVWQAKQFEQRTGIVCALEIDDDECLLGDTHATAVFRIVQEALTNISKHANASHVRIRMQRAGGRLFVEISDDGIGCVADDKPASGGFGLVGMEERIYALGGTFSIASDAGLGTTIMLSILCTSADFSATEARAAAL
jgi:signal transduction histidine kinase